MILFETIVLACLGAIIGSFLNMLIHRLPRGEDTVFKRSHCVHCERSLGVLELIPIVSYLVQGGRCKGCKTRISPRYVLCEIVAVVAILIPYSVFGLSWVMAKWVFYLWAMLALFFIDLETYLLPDRLTVLVCIIGGIIGVYEDNVADVGRGFLCGGAAYYVVSLIGELVYKKPVMGMGDVKLGAAIGAYWGLKVAAVTVYLSFLLGGVIGLVLLILKRKSRQDEVPFGPMIILASLVAITYGEELWRYVFW